MLRRAVERINRRGFLSERGVYGVPIRREGSPEARIARNVAEHVRGESVRHGRVREESGRIGAIM